MGDKQLPNYLNGVGETAGPAVDNLNRTEKPGLIGSAEIWITLRDLCNQMVHEYMEDLDNLTEALNKRHEHVSTLTADATRILVDLEVRG